MTGVVPSNIINGFGSVHPTSPDSLAAKGAAVPEMPLRESALAASAHHNSGLAATALGDHYNNNNSGGSNQDSRAALAAAAAAARSTFMEFKKEAQKLIQESRVLVLVCDPGPADVAADATPGNNNHNDSSICISNDPSTQLHKQQLQRVRCAEVDTCCLALQRVLRHESPFSQNVEWSATVSALPLVLVNTNSAVNKFRRATKLNNGCSSFVCVVENFFKAEFYVCPLDRISSMGSSSSYAKNNNSSSPTSNNSGGNDDDMNNNNTSKSSNNGLFERLAAQSSILSVCHKLLEQHLATFLQKYQAVPRQLEHALLGLARPEADYDDHLGDNICALVQQTYQEQLHNPCTCTLVLYHTSTCPACPGAICGIAHIVQHLREAVSTMCASLSTTSSSPSSAALQCAQECCDLKRGFVDFTPLAGLVPDQQQQQQHHQQPQSHRPILLVFGALNVEENEIDQKEFPQLTVPHIRFFPCGDGSAKASRATILERHNRCPVTLLNLIKEAYSACLQQCSVPAALLQVIGAAFDLAAVTLRQAKERCTMAQAEREKKEREGAAGTAASCCGDNNNNNNGSSGGESAGAVIGTTIDAESVTKIDAEQKLRDLSGACRRSRERDK